MTTFCILSGANVVITMFANSQLPTDQVGYRELDADGAGIGSIWNGASFDPPPLTNVMAAFIKQVDADVDVIYAAVIGNRATEYTQANAEATTYKAAGYTGTVPPSVQSWATAKGWAAQAACDDILTSAVRLTELQERIRAARLTCKEMGRSATDQAALATAVSQWAAALAEIKAAAGL